MEGKTDAKYLKKVTKLIFPNTNICYLQANADSEIVPYLIKVSDFLNGLATSLYRDRLFVVLDDTYAPSIVSGLTNKGVVAENISEWSKNGIEFYYPKDIIESIFNCRYSEVESVKLTGTDRITINKITKTKVELREEVIAKVTEASIYNDELNEKLLTKIKNKLH